MSNNLSVSQFLDILNSTLDFTTADFGIEGEITGFQKHPSGYYFSIKDIIDASILQCYLPPRVKISGDICDGASVVISGKANIYKPKGRLSLIVEKITLAGEGTLKRQYELLKSKLENEGLFERKRLLPRNISKIGLITSRTGAVIEDFKNNLAKLGYEILFYDSRVEGATAISSILSGLEYFTQHSDLIDCLVIIRGGGSLEDLQAFNNESIARAIFKSRVPTICAIGHDKDVPLAQLVADSAPSTPTATAFIINNTWQETLSINTYAKNIFTDKIADEISMLKDKVNNARHAIVGIFSLRKEYYRNLDKRLTQSINLLDRNIILSKNRLDLYRQKLNDFNPKNILKRGYAILYDDKDKIVTNFTRLKKLSKIKIRNYSQEILAKVEEINND